MEAQPIYVGIETGGTKIVCRVVTASGMVLSDTRFATGTPAAAMDVIESAVRGAVGGRPVTAVGIASFGPVMLEEADPRFGRLMATPKEGWTGFDLAGEVRRRLGAPVAIDTDVNAAALAEQRLGAGRGFRSVAYVTVGTGIGGGLASEGKTLKGALHPEIGHILLQRRRGDAHPSSCPFHADCAEGLAAGGAVRARLGATRSLSDAPAVAALIADYLGQLTAALLLAWSPHCIVLGGGVIKGGELLPRIDASMRAALAGYGAGDIAGAGYLSAAELDDAGLEGALLMARSSAPT